MARGITIWIDRAAAIRELGAVIRRKIEEFETAKARRERDLELTRTKVQKACEKRLKDVLRAESVEKLTELARADLMAWKDTQNFPTTPELRVCQEKELLLMLQRDVRKIVPVNSNHPLWSILQGKCEVVRG